MGNKYVSHKTHSEKIDYFSKRYEGGDKYFLLEALRLCCVSKERKLADWVARAVVIAIDKWDRAKVRTLDEAFDVERPKGYRRGPAEKKRALQSYVYIEVINLITGGHPVDESLFESVGEKFGIGKTQATIYYYDFKKRIDPLIESFKQDISKKK